MNTPVDVAGAGRFECMSPEVFRKKWIARRDEYHGLGVQIDGAMLCDAVLSDFEDVLQHDPVLLNLTEAAKRSGFSRGHLGRLVRQGRIPNAGRPNAPRILLSDLPIRLGHLPPRHVPGQVTRTSKAQIVRSIVNA